MKKLLLVACLLSLVGCATSLNPFKGIGAPPDAPRKMGSWEQTSKPVVVGKDAQGEYIVAYENRYVASASEVVPPLTFSQRLGRWVSSLSIAAIIFIVVSLVAFGGAPILWIWSKFLKARSALKKTVEGIEQLSEEDQANVKEELKKTQDTRDKEYVLHIKNELKKQKGLAK